LQNNRREEIQIDLLLPKIVVIEDLQDLAVKKISIVEREISGR
jgi:hypothetical protein